MSTSFTQVFGGNTIYPSDVSYLALSLTSDITLEWPLEATAGNNVVARIIDVTPTGIHTIFMPDATKVSVGQTILFNNLGPDIVTVDTAAGNAILSMNAGEQWQIYLTDNTTVAGSWRVFRYGAATAQAQASALAGPGIVALGSTLAQNAEVVAFSSSPTTTTVGDRAKTFVWTDGLGTITLPTAVSATNGWFINLRNSGTGDLVVDPSGAELINGASTLTLQPGDSASIVTNGIQWYSIGLGQQAVFAFDYTSISVTTGTYTLSGSELNRIAYKFTGALTGNVTVVVPATVQQYWVNNQTTGAFTLSLRVSGSASPVTVPQNTTGIYYSDGTNIITATTAAAFAGVVGITQGGTGATTAPGALTNLGGTGIGTSVFTAATTAAARSAIAAAASGANSDITSLTGLTTPLSVAQGGTGSGTAAGARSNLSAAQSGSNSDITALTASGGIQIGAPTGGAQGTGTINATGLYINGVGVGTGSGSVTSINVSGGTTGLTTSGGPVTTSGTITLAGTLAVANGGTGQTSYTDGQLLIGNSTGNTLTKATLTAGSGITITNGGGSITIASTAGGGTVTSVDASGGTTGLSFTGGPITSAGTLTLGGTLAVTNGGTGAATASGARLNLGAAASGANSDITSLSGLSTALSVAQGGTGSTTAGGARTSLGAAASGANSDITSLSGLTTALSVAQGGTGSTTASGARTNLGATTVGGNFFTLANPSAVTFPRINADNTVSALDAASFRTAIGAGTGGGSVTSVSGTGTVNGITLTGTVTSSGSLTLGGTLSGVSLTSQVSGTLPVANGGTGATTLSSGYLVKGNGTSAVSASAIYDDGFGNVGIGTTNPLYTLSVVNDGSYTKAANNTASSIIYMNKGRGSVTSPTNVSSGDNLGAVWFSGYSGSGNNGGYGYGAYVGGAVDGALSGTSVPGRLVFATTTSGNSSPSERMRITSTGNVGINTTVPSEKLDVNGNVSLWSTFSYFLTNTDYGMGTPDGTGLQIFTSGSPADIIRFGQRTGGTFTERMRIDASGNVGIATASPGSRLDVSGTVTATSFSGAGTGLTGTASSLSIGGSAATLTTARTFTIGATGRTFNGSANVTWTLSDIGAAASGANTDITSLASSTTINGVTIGYRSIPRSTTSGTAAVGDVGKCIAVTAGITIPNATFAAGDAISIYNDSASSVTITQGASLTLRQAGTTNTGNRTLAARGMATIWFNSASEAIISGAGVS